MTAFATHFEIVDESTGNVWTGVIFGKRGNIFATPKQFKTRRGAEKHLATITACKDEKPVVVEVEN